MCEDDEGKILYNELELSDIMINLNKILKSEVAEPDIKCSSAHDAYSVSNVLKPYISGFWGTGGPITDIGKFYDEPIYIVPDLYFDLIFEVDHITGKVDILMVGLGDRPIIVKPIQEKYMHSRFAIQFYFWSIQYFIDETMCGTFNSGMDADAYFVGWKDYFANMLLETLTIKDRIIKAEKFIYSKIETNRCNDNLFNSIYYMMKTNGATSVSDICSYATVSQRQMERMYQNYIGCSIKKMSGLIRYQSLWWDCVHTSRFDIQDAVCKYNYFDQSHLLNDFKKYHGMNLKQAMSILNGMNNNVDFLQEKKNKK